MIYLIRSAAFKDKSNPKCMEYEPILKIGYTKDDGKKSRFDCYITENPTCQVLYLIPEGDEQDERNLHYHFRNYLKYGQEWFSYEEEILDFFKTHTTKASLKSLIVKLSEKNLIKKIKDIESVYINPVLRSKIKESLSNYILIENELYKLLETDLCFLNQSEIDEYFNKTYPGIDFTYTEKDYPNTIKDQITHFYEYSNMSDQLKFIVKQSELLSEADFNLLLDYLPVRFSGYISLLGVDRIKSFSYQMSRIAKYLNNVVISEESKNSITNDIHTKFIIGERYTKSYIKETLRSIYESNNYGKTPKANDLEQYFELKPCQITNKETGKLDNGYRIIKTKN